jgi:hypothetical protein
LVNYRDFQLLSQAQYTPAGDTLQHAFSSSPNLTRDNRIEITGHPLQDAPVFVE